MDGVRCKQSEEDSTYHNRKKGFAKLKRECWFVGPTWFLEQHVEHEQKPAEENSCSEKEYELDEWTSYL